MQVHLLNLLRLQQLIISPFTYFPIILALKKPRRSLSPVLKGQFEQMVMEALSHSVVAPWERASSRPRNSKKEKEHWRLLNSLLQKLQWVQTCEISSRWELHNFLYKPRIFRKPCPVSKSQQKSKVVSNAADTQDFTHSDTGMWSTTCQQPASQVGTEESKGVGWVEIDAILKDLLTIYHANKSPGPPSGAS